ncbi:MAG: hypothetical protein ACRD0A_16210 [Acidimicrobiales bacterium]
MDVVSILRLVGRRWRVTVPAMILTVLLVAGAVASSPPTYKASGSMVLLEPPSPPALSPTATTVVTENAYERFNDLSVVVDIVARIVTGETMRAALQERGVGDYDVAGNVNFARGPIIEVTAEEPSPEAALASAAVLLAEVRAVLHDRQEAQGTDPRYFITTDDVVVPAETTTVLSATIRSAMAALALGGLLTLAVAAIAESIAKHRSVRARAPRPVAAAPARRMTSLPGRTLQLRPRPVADDG